MTRPPGSPDEPIELLSVQEMARVDRLAAEAGTPVAILMDRAGSAVADQCRAMLGRMPGLGSGRGRSVLVLCGPGNNGGDGFVAARRLLAAGYDVEVATLGPVEAMRHDSAAAAEGWKKPISQAGSVSFDGVHLIVDALFGAGLSRPMAGEAAILAERVNTSGIPVVAVDVPSGLDGDTGAARGPVIRAQTTVTFFRAKPGHLLLPGRSLCGDRVLADIGIDPAFLGAIGPTVLANRPSLWSAEFPWPRPEGHKYSRGHALVLSGPASATGAARLSARAALRVGAGLVTLGSPTDALAVNGAHLTAIMLRPCDGAADLAELLSDPRKNMVVLGPGLGLGERTRALVAQALAPDPRSGRSRAVVLDADALMSFAEDARTLAGLIAGASSSVVVTPHEGEFERLFGGGGDGSRLDRARIGAGRLGAVMLLKGPDTVVAEPGGRASIAEADAPWLATAGSGDVLAGMVGGLLAQAMPAFEAASAAVYLHAATARRLGAGLIAEDLPEGLPVTLGALQSEIG